MRFALRYWTRRSASTIAVPCATNPDAIASGAECLRGWANRNNWPILGEAFLRFPPGAEAVLHLPVDLGGEAPRPPMRAGHIDHGHVVAAYDVCQANALQVGQALVAQLEAQSAATGPFEYHFDPSVGRTEGIVVVPVNEHPADKCAYLMVRGAVADEST